MADSNHRDKTALSYTERTNPHTAPRIQRNPSEERSRCLRRTLLLPPNPPVLSENLLGRGHTAQRQEPPPQRRIARARTVTARCEVQRYKGEIHSRGQTTVLQEWRTPCQIPLEQFRQPVRTSGMAGRECQGSRLQGSQALPPERWVRGGVCDP